MVTGLLERAVADGTVLFGSWLPLLLVPGIVVGTAGVSLFGALGSAVAGISVFFVSEGRGVLLSAEVVALVAVLPLSTVTSFLMAVVVIIPAKLLVTETGLLVGVMVVGLAVDWTAVGILDPAGGTMF